ncbi:MAG: sigma-70 family RNA polymerase sigma factor [Pirellulales bacterium]|nr:sigma-70 family RNA polymerase sigma factor [Pirellulales bacterium]
MAFTDVDRDLLARCLERKPKAWEAFVDRFMGLVVHVVNHTAQSRSVRLTPQDREDLCAEVFLALLENDFAILRHFRGLSSLATYLTVVARRVVVRELLKRRAASKLAQANGANDVAAGGEPVEQRITDRDEVERLLEELSGHEADAVRLFHLEGKSYQEISSALGVPENSIGPLLSRAREKMRRAATAADSSQG